MAAVHQQLNGSAQDAGGGGLATAEALRRLQADIESVLAGHQRQQRRGWLAAAALQRRVWFSWPVLLLSTLVAAILMVSAALAPDGGVGEAVATILVLALAAANAALSMWQRALADGELAAKAGRLAERLGRAATTADDSGGWAAAEYPHLHAPPSPCIGLQWTHRDGRLVNLPASLLTRGDVVVLRPGEAALADVESLPGEQPPLRLSRLELYVPGGGLRADEKLAQPRLVAALPNRQFRVLAAPYLESLRLALDAGERPPPTLRRELRRLLTAVLLACLPAALLAAVMVAVPLQTWLLPETVVGAAARARLLLQRLCCCLLPVLPLPCSLVLVPAAWLAQARLVALTREMRQPRPDDRGQLDVLDETSVQEHVAARWRHVWPVLRDTALGRCDSLPHTASLLYTLGALTSLCCVDKKGVLSWPNATAEKVVTARLKGGAADEPAAVSDGASDVSDPADLDPVTCDAALDVLDLTRDNPAEPWSIQFDDPHWRDSLARLKPIGLAVLVNTCSEQTLADYWQFCRHMVCLAHGEADLVPVPARRCLCQLAKQIGFSPRAADAFQLDSQVACYKHLKLDQARRDKLTRAFSFSKIRFPYPHMSSVILRELYTNSLQLVSQGTADLVLDSCSDFWDGTDVIPLSEADRRRILDFYHRHSLTMYCSAFAYRPLTSKVSVELTERYLELPEESAHIYRAARSPAPGHGLSVEPWDKPVHPQYMSTDSLYGSEVVDVDSTEGLIQVQCNQIFTGMVTMQYQALADMVRLIDHLEKACIRFVHFSKENELRSRVFSEKMGLESGWNCHISLLEDGSHHPSVPGGETAQHPPAQRLASDESGSRALERLRPLSVSAPSVINLELEETAGCDGCSAPSADGQTDGRTRVQSECACPPAAADSPGLPEAASPVTSRSSSHLTDSSDQSDPVNFDMSNRAKLPKGIAQIRPHLEHVDNVPLLVSLFTDCTPATTRAMLEIMQEYGEVVCVLGSSGSPQNAAMFLQADAALAVRPLHPQLCSMVPECGTATTANTDTVGGGDSPDRGAPNGGGGDGGRQPLLPASLSADGPVALAERLDSLPCSLVLRRDDAVSLTQLVLEARHLVQRLRTAVAFWACQAVTLAALGVISALLLLPPPLPAGHLVWFACVQLPLLSGALLAAPADGRIMEEAQDRCPAELSLAQLVYAGWCYGLRLLTGLLCALAFFGLSLYASCPETDCQYVYPAVALRPVQSALLVLLVLYACVGSAAFVHRRSQLWQRWPCDCRPWSGAVLVSLLLAVLFVVLDSAANGQLADWPAEMVPYLAAAALGGPLLQLAATELVKRQEFKYNIRYQKRARLEFDTKLGMNSPF